MSTRISNPTLKALTVLSWLLASVSTGTFAQSAEETVLAVERAWLDAYHARVRETVGPRVDEATRRWLAEATAPVAK